MHSVANEIEFQGPVKIRNDIKNALIDKISKSTDLNQVIDHASSSAALLVSLGIAKTCKVVLDSRGLNDIRVILKSEKPAWISAKTGTQIGSSDGNIKGSFSLKNIFHGGENLDVNAVYGLETSNPINSSEKYQADSSKVYQLQFTSPINLDPDQIVEVNIQKALRDLTTTSSYLENSWGSDVNYHIQNRFSGNHKFSLGIKFRELIGVNGATSWSVLKDSGHHMKTHISYEWVKENRNDPVLPSSGYFARLFQEIAHLGSESSYFKYDLDLQKIIPVSSSGFCLSLSARHGILWPLKGSSLIPDRFFLGGPLSVRGFQHHGLAPSDMDDRIGGNAYWCTGASLLTPLPYIGKDGPVKGHLFVNSGKLAHTTEEFFNASKMLKSSSLTTGIGVAIKFSVLRAEINYCFPMYVSSGDRLKAGLQFGIGLNFL